MSPRHCSFIILWHRIFCISCFLLLPMYALYRTQIRIWLQQISPFGLLLKMLSVLFLFLKALLLADLLTRCSSCHWCTTATSSYVHAWLVTQRSSTAFHPRSMHHGWAFVSPPPSGESFIIYIKCFNGWWIQGQRNRKIFRASKPVCQASPGATSLVSHGSNVRRQVT